MTKAQKLERQRLCKEILAKLAAPFTPQELEQFYDDWNKASKKAMQDTLSSLRP